jgi:hypothetical protein
MRESPIDQPCRVRPQHSIRSQNGPIADAKFGVLHEAGLSPRTVQYCRAVLRKTLNKALWDALVARNAAALADPPRCRTRRSRHITAEEAQVDVTGNYMFATFGDGPTYVSGIMVRYYLPYSGDREVFHCAASTRTMGMPPVRVG